MAPYLPLIGLTLALAAAATLRVRRRTLRDLRAAHRALLVSERRFRALVQNSSDLTLLIDDGGDILYASPALESVIGIAPDAALGVNLCSLVPPDEAERLTAQMQPLADTHEVPVEFFLEHADGTKRFLDGTAVNLLEEEAVSAIVFNVRDLTQRRELEAELAKLAFHDPLTGLANRALLRERITHAAARALRAPGSDAALLLIDLDDFKSVNDGLGHREGDRLLQAVAQRLEDAIRAQDTAARLGGDEFVIFAENVGGADQAAALADRVLAALEEPFELTGATIHCRGSIGIRWVGGEALDADDLLRDADLAMYSAKRTGKAAWAVFEDRMQDDASERLVLGSELHGALERDELELHYQPIVDLHTERVTGFEALVRWQHPTRGLLAPDRFIGLAESTGLIHPLGDWVIREATAALRRLRTGHETLTMNVNLSPLQLERASVVDVVRAALAVADVPPSSLSLEVTESVFLADDVMVAERLRALHALGVRIALDDFGTGFSSLGYLERLPLEGLKIDRAFVASATGEDGAPGQVLGAIAGLANGLGLSSVAEGIETREQLAIVRALGCDRGQGYLFSRPLTEANAVAYLALDDLHRGADRDEVVDVLGLGHGEPGAAV
ncbi:EAL domain-containing protein [Solirubrobacter taibaiensis]|nr:EAL domain-containing protein [Solirubrobacter taibaiensis]